MTDKIEFASEDVAMGSPGFVSPLSVNFSPDGSMLTYLFPDEKGSRQVFGVDLEKDTKEAFQLIQNRDANQELSLQEQLRRERMRLFTQGLSTYEWTEHAATQRIMIPLNGNVFLYNGSASNEDDKYTLVYDSQVYGEAVDPHISPDGTMVAFVIKDDLYVHAVGAEAGVAPLRLTVNGVKTGVTCGLADYIAQEEMSRFRGFWWSPDSQSIAYCEADETAVPEYKILHQGKADPTHSETHHYPFAGDVNPSVKLAVVRVPSSLLSSASEAVVPDSVWMTLIDQADKTFQVAPLSVETATSTEQPASTPTTEPSTEYYLARVGWWADGSVMAQVEDRAQSVLQLLRIDPVSGAHTVVLEERSGVWINLHEMLRPLSAAWTPPTAVAGENLHREGDFYFLWCSERTGFSQLYLYKFDSLTGRGVNLSGDVPIGGGGNWVVESVDGVDETNNIVYFSGNRDNATERHLYAAHFAPTTTSDELTTYQLTTEHGFHNATVDVKSGFVADVFSSITSPVVLELYRLGPDFSMVHVTTLVNNFIPGSRLCKPGLFESMVPPVFQTIRSTDGAVDLHCAVYLPPGTTLASSLKLPAVMSVYGGPHVQTVRNQWTLTADLRSQRMAQQGIVVIKCDNRGSSRRGLAFEGAMRWDMGNVEVADQSAAVAHFAGTGLIDAARVGMFGWSYGGYMSAMSLCRAPDVFSCAVAGAPVTSWDGYDTHYTERYMGTPQNNAAGYAASSVMSHVDTMRGKLLLVHGLIDENVHFRHTARLINRLIECRKRYELVLFPCERHSPHKAQDRVYMEDIMMEFFTKNLAPVVLTNRKIIQLAEEAEKAAAGITSSDVTDAAGGDNVKIAAHL